MKRVVVEGIGSAGLLALLVPAAACHLEAADHVVLEGTGGAGGADTGTPPQDTADTGDTAASGHGAQDGDGDGYTEEDGDCDDGDPSVHPGASDGCDGQDTDCDGSIDEDASSEDAYEPNDDQWVHLGNLEDDDLLSLTAWLHNDQDVDRFSFEIADHWWDSFGIEVTLSNIPADARYRLSLGWIDEDGELGEAVSDEGGETLVLEVEGTAFQDDGGTWGVVVESVAGADCSRSYALSISG